MLIKNTDNGCLKTHADRAYVIKKNIIYSQNVLSDKLLYEYAKKKSEKESKKC